MTSANQASSQSTTEQRDAFLERLFDSVTGAMDVTGYLLDSGDPKI